MARHTYVLAAALLSACTLQRAQPGSAEQHLASAAVDDHSAHMQASDLAAPSSVPRMLQDRPGLPPSNNGAAARVKASPRHAEWVKVAWEPGSADSLMAWVVYPASKNSRERAPVVVVVHEIFGLSTWVRGVADQVAADGFIAVAPDMLSRVRGGPSSVELSGDTARRLIAGVNAAERNRAIVAAANYAMMQPSAQPKYAVIGYCWGGQTVFMHAVHGGVQGYSGGVAFYGISYLRAGTPATATAAATSSSVDSDSLARISKPLMLLNGSKDARIAAAMPALDSVMKALKKNYSQTNYEGAIHGFLRAQDDPRAPRAGEEVVRDPAEEAANLAATRDAWPRTITFLRKNLGVK